MVKQFELVEPRDEIINYYNDLWKNDDRINETILLFENSDKVLVGDLLFPNGFISNKESDEKIETAFKNHNSKDFLSLIDKTYSTQLRIKPEKWEDENWSIDRIKEYCKYNDKEIFGNIDGFINVCNTITGKNTYSFASKVFSFVDNNRYPIIDSISVSLLNVYYEKYFGEPNRKRKWGYYKNYVDDYKTLLNKLRDKSVINTNVGFKEFDIFIWLYGKAIQQYWKNIGVIDFSKGSITYKPKEETT